MQRLAADTAPTIPLTNTATEKASELYTQDLPTRLTV
jgi:hypothetical protein